MTILLKKAEIYINFYTGKIAEYEDKINDLRRCNNGTGQTKKEDKVIRTK